MRKKTIWLILPALVWPQLALAQTIWTTDAYEPRPAPPQRSWAPPPPSQPARPAEAPAGRWEGQWEGQWRGQWVPAAPVAPPPTQQGYVDSYSGQSAYYAAPPGRYVVEEAPPVRHYREQRWTYGDSYSSMASNSATNVFVQTAPITVVTTETVTEYVVDESYKSVRRSVGTQAKRRVVKRPRCVCQMVYR